MQALLALIVVFLSAGCGLLLDPDPPAHQPGDAAVRDGAAGDGAPWDGAPGTCRANRDCTDCERCADGVCESVVGQRCSRSLTCKVGIYECNDGERRCELSATAPAGTVCRPAVDACDEPEACDGEIEECPDDELAPVGTVCPAGVCTDEGECDTGCDDGAPCDTGFDCEAGSWSCDPELGPTCVSTGVLSAGTRCRASAGLCDLAEYCDGMSRECPVNALEPSGHACRPPSSAIVCDLPELCDGASAYCPDDGPRMPVGTACGVAAPGFCAADGTCDTDCPLGAPCRLPGDSCEVGRITCTGGAATCIGTGAARDGGDVCREAAQLCDLTEVCDGTSLVCPPDAHAPSSMVCRPAAGPCDAAEYCAGDGLPCGPDALASSTTDCRPSAGACDEPEFCTGSSDRCPSNAFAPGGTVCGMGGSLGPCDEVDTCNGSTADCQPAFKPAGTRCAVSTVCGVDATCSGVDAVCPSPTPVANGTDCGCGECLDGLCTAGIRADACGGTDTCCIESSNAIGTCTAMFACVPRMPP